MIRDVDPDKEYICPSCGDPLDWMDDAHGIMFQCHNLECLELYEFDEIVEEEQ